MSRYLERAAEIRKLVHEKVRDGNELYEVHHAIAQAMYEWADLFVQMAEEADSRRGRK